MKNYKYLSDIKPKIYKSGNKLKRGDFRYCIIVHHIITDEDEVLSKNLMIEESKQALKEIEMKYDDRRLYTDIKIVLQEYWL